MNGMGIYTAADSLSAQWLVAQPMGSPATAGIQWDLRQLAAAAQVVGWEIREFVAATKVVPWDLRQFASKGVSAVWDVGQGAVNFLVAKWRVPFSPHSGSALSRTGAASSLVPHTATSTISEH